MLTKCQWTFIWLLTVCLINRLNGKIQPVVSREYIVQRTVAKCVLAISDEHFPTGDIITLVAAANNQQRYILRAFSGTNKWTVFVQKHTNKSVHMCDSGTKPNNYVLLLKHEDNLKDILVSLKRLLNWNPFAKFIVVVQQNQLTSVVTFTAIINSFRIFNVIIVLGTNSSALLNIYTWFPYANGSCADRFHEIQRINQCQAGVLADNRTNLFPDKIPHDLNGCYVKARPVFVPPYTIRPPNLDPTKSNLNLTKGLEILLLNTIAVAANFKVNYSVSSKGMDWGSIVENNSVLVGASGLMKALLENEIDVGFGCMGATAIRNKYLDYTIPQMQEDLVWCVPHALPLAKWKSLIAIFGPFTWTLTVVTFFLVAICLWALAHNRPLEPTSFRVLSCCMTNMLAVLLSVSIGVQPRSGHNRMLFIIWIIVSLHLTISYQTALMSVLTLPLYDKQISTMDELFDSKIPFGFSNTAIRFFENQTDWQSRKIVNEWVPCTDSYLCMKAIAVDRNYAFAYSRSFLEYVQGYFLDADNKPLIYTFKEGLANFPVILQLSKGFPFTQRFNSLIARVRQAGLIDLWFERLLWERKVNGKSTTGRLHKLTLFNVQGAFILLGFGLCLASIVHVVELVVEKYKRTLRNASKISQTVT